MASSMEWTHSKAEGIRRLNQNDYFRVLQTELHQSSSFLHLLTAKSLLVEKNQHFNRFIVPRARYERDEKNDFGYYTGCKDATDFHAKSRSFTTFLFFP